MTWEEREAATRAAIEEIRRKALASQQRQTNADWANDCLTLISIIDRLRDRKP